MTETLARVVFTAALVVGSPWSNLWAAESENEPVESRSETAGKFLAGAAVGLGAHEGAHLLFDCLFAARPHLKKVDFKGVPFFAIAHRGDLSRRREFVISSAGFWMQHATMSGCSRDIPGCVTSTGRC